MTRCAEIRLRLSLVAAPPIMLAQERKRESPGGRHFAPASAGLPDQVPGNPMNTGRRIASVRVVPLLPRCQ